ncbi:MAG: VanW family protein [Candidatus Aminicenantes bacterium]|nr:VanW family protein [Candidatus Aminicenantes bacterium]
MKKFLKAVIPSSLRKILRIFLIAASDLIRGTRFKFSKNSSSSRSEGESWPKRITISQRINASDWAENKKHNLLLAVSKFQNLAIYPGKIFSFWHHVGNPSKKAGYKVGINIIKNKLDFAYGGGLCQLSGLLYHLAMTAGLYVVERYPHSVDLYTDETRYTPLGADATTAFGYKDLRLLNNLKIPLCFRIRIEGDQLIGSICAAESLNEYELKFNKTVIDKREEVDTLRRNESGQFEVITKQTYLISDHDQIL